MNKINMFKAELCDVSLIVAPFLSCRKGRSVSELSGPRKRSESPLLDAQQHSCTALAAVEHALMTAAAHPPSLAPWGFASTALMERASTETSCGSSAAAAVQAAVYSAGPPALQSASTTTSISSGTEADSSYSALAWHRGQRLPPSKQTASLCVSWVSCCHPLPNQAIHSLAL